MGNKENAICCSQDFYPENLTDYLNMTRL